MLKRKGGRCDNFSTSRTEEKTKSVGDETREQIRIAEQYIQINPNHRDVVLVLGDTGAGKSTTTKFITGHQLRAKKSGAYFLIEDDEGKIKNSMESETLYPAMYLDEETGTTYYDLPGFNDTRSSSVQLTNAWATQKVASHASQVKVMIVCNFSTVTPGENRTEFKTLLKLVSDFIPKPERFQNSICLVATKAPNDADDEIIPTIVKYLQQAKKDVQKVFKSDRKLLDQATDLIDILLTNKRGVYSRIGYFKRPAQDGTFQNQKYYQEQKERLRQMIEVAVEFTSPTESDFGISVSDEAKLYIRDVNAKFGEEFSENMERLGKSIELSCSNSGGTISKLRHKSNALKTAIPKLLKVYEREDFVKILSDDLGDLPGVEEELKNLKELNEKINFFADLGQDIVGPQHAKWTAPLTAAASSMEDTASKCIEILSASTEKNLVQIIESTVSGFKGSLKSPSTDYESQKPILERGKLNFFVVKTMKSELTSTQTFNAFAGTVNKAVEKLSFQPVGRVQEIAEDIQFSQVPQLNFDLWMSKITEMLSEFSAAMAELNAKLQAMLSDGKVKGMEGELKRLQDEQKKADEQYKNQLEALQKQANKAKKLNENLERDIEATKRQQEDDRRRHHQDLDNLRAQQQQQSNDTSLLDVIVDVASVAVNPVGFALNLARKTKL